MKRRDLEHIIRAASALTNEYEFIIIGSQSILGAYPNAPDDLLISAEADIYPVVFNQLLCDLIDGAIGEDSTFQALYGYYAQGVGPETAVLPKNWEERLIKIQNENTNLHIGYCLEPHDLAISKLIAGREKDGEFVSKLIGHELVSPAILIKRTESLEISDSHKMSIISWISNNSIDNKDEHIEIAKRISEINSLKAKGGSAYTFWQIATDAIKKVSSPMHVNWQIVENKTAAESISEHGQDPTDVATTLCKYSPGAATAAKQWALREQIAGAADVLQAHYESKRATRDGPDIVD